MTRRPGPARVLATVPLHERSGGVAAVSRLVWQSFQSRWGDDAELITLRENDETALSFGEKLRFGARVATSQIRRARWVFFGHVGPARVQSRFPAGWQRPYGVFLHGVEVWARLSDPDRAMLRQARVRIANSRHTARCTAELNADIGHIDICPLSMSTEQEAAIAARTPGPPETREPVVLMVGRLNAAEAYKGHTQVIGAWPAVVAACPEARLVIAGEGDDRPRLEALAHSTGVADRIDFTGFVSSEELDRLYERAALFALPSRGEGFGIVYLEAMARALPCLASRHDAAGDVVADGETGFLVSQEDRAEIASRIVTLLANPELRGRMGRAGVARVQTQFSFAQFSRGLIELLDARLERPE